MSLTIRIRIETPNGRAQDVRGRRGKTLREALIEAGVPLYKGAFRMTNCRGLGVCGSCRVNVRENGALWNRRSCQLRLSKDIEIELDEVR